ncbi:MAG: hypothetical protein ACI8TX_001258 [Hyphomicrobiaceae bacterium]|jgi:hypothetical protein
MSGNEAPSIFVQRAVWGSAFMSLSVCAAFPWIVDSTPSQALVGHDPTFFGVLLATCALLSVAFILWRTVKLAPVHEGRLSPRSNERGAHVHRVSLLVWTIAQAIGLYGLCLYLMVEETAYLYGFIAAAIFLLSINAPERMPETAPVPRLEHPGSCSRRHMLASNQRL